VLVQVFDFTYSAAWIESAPVQSWLSRGCYEWNI